MKTFKRDNWTNEEVISILQGRMIVNKDGIEDMECKEMNIGLDSAISQFSDFIRNPKEFGAMAYIIEDKEIVHIGEIPPE